MINCKYIGPAFGFLLAQKVFTSNHRVSEKLPGMERRTADTTVAAAATMNRSTSRPENTLAAIANDVSSLALTQGDEGSDGLQVAKAGTTGPTTAGTKATTLYPKIFSLDSGEFQYAIETLPEYRDKIRGESQVHLTGSVKLHGTHADIVFATATSSEYRLQSRSRTEIAVGKKTDNYGFAAFVATLHPNVLPRLRDRLYRKLNPKVDIEGEIVIAGEWCGQGIQKGVAIKNVPKFLAIISVNINGVWVPDWNYADIDDEKSRIYHVGCAGFYTQVLDLNDLIASIEEIKRSTNDVERECRFARRVFGVVGKGEGIVWKATNHCGDARFWFKSKGDSLAVSHLPKLPAAALDRRNERRVEAFAAAIVPLARLEQGWHEVQPTDATSIDTFLDWVTKDCLVEENRAIKLLCISKSELSKAIIDIARPWFCGRLDDILASEV